VGKSLVISAGARRDYDESFDWYAEKSPEAAVRFAAAVDDALRQIQSQPDRHSRTSDGCRYCPIKRFPFRVIFWQDASRIVIVAIANGKRRPDYWQERLESN
jgi:plasmid stabilization system protein ParE